MKPRIHLLTLATLVACCAPFRLPSQALTDKPTQHAVSAALVGKWAGVLEYRDYSKPESSTDRVQLPTWLTVASAHEGLYFDYTYDDGPAKVVSSHSTVLIDLGSNTYKVMSTDSVAETYTIAGDEKLRDGHGELVLSGPGTENGKPIDVRTTLRIGRNILTMLKETRPAGSAEPFAFRDRYVFTRATAPQATGTR